VPRDGTATAREGLDLNADARANDMFTDQAGERVRPLG
jgi:hypothetical protein